MVPLTIAPDTTLTRAICRATWPYHDPVMSRAACGILQLPNPYHVARPERTYRGDRCRHQEGRISQSIGWPTQNHQGNPAPAQVLLVRDALIDGNQHIKTGCLGGFQETPVLQPRQIGETGVWQSWLGNRRRSRSSTHSSIRSFMRLVRAEVFGPPPALPRLERAERSETPEGSLPGCPLPPGIRTASARALAFPGIQVRRALFPDLR